MLQTAKTLSLTNLHNGTLVNNVRHVAQFFSVLRKNIIRVFNKSLMGSREIT